jgi:hypothetical protein
LRKGKTNDGLTTDNLYLPRDGRIVYLFVKGKWQGAVLLDPRTAHAWFLHDSRSLADLSFNRNVFWVHVASLLAFTPDMKNNDAEEASR